MIENGGHDQQLHGGIKFLGTDEEIIKGFSSACKFLTEKANGMQQLGFYEAAATMFEERPYVHQVVELMAHDNENVASALRGINQVRQARVMAMMNGGRTCAGNVTEKPVIEQIGFLASCGKYAEKLCRQIDNAGHQTIQTIKEMFSGKQHN